MQRRTPLFVVCSPRPRVGKTLLARVLTDYFRADERPVAAFDVNPDEFPLMDYLPGHTAVASVAQTRDQIALFDQLLADDRVPKVVDLGHFQFDAFFTVIEQIGFVDEARRRAIAPVVIFVADGNRRSLQGYVRVTSRHPRLAVIPLINEALPNVARFRHEFPASRRGGPPLTVPALSPMIRAVIERPSFSFAALAATSADPTSEICGWTRRVFIAFRELELRLLLDDLTPALKVPA